MKDEASNIYAYVEVYWDGISIDSVDNYGQK